MQAISVPDLGDIRNARIVEMLVAPGSHVQMDDALVLLETDKATLEVPAPFAGVVGEMMAAIGDAVQQGTALLMLKADAFEAKIAAPSSSPPAMAPAIEVAVAASVPAPSQGTGATYAGPSVRKLARELGIDLSGVAGSGESGRVQIDDVHRHVQRVAGQGTQVATAPVSALPPWPVIDFARFGPVERQRISRVRQISGPALARNAATIPHVTNFDEADVTELEELRQRFNAQDAGGGARITLLTFLIKAVVATLRAYPSFNASLDGDHLVLKQYFHIGFAADTPNGLLVPVVRDADRKGIAEIAREMADLAAQARGGLIRQGSMEGGCFSISSLGGIGGQGFTPIINAPEVAILGVAKAAIKPVWDGTAFAPRLMLPLALSWDHRVVDGAEAARFLVHLSGLLGDFRQILL